MLSMRLRYVGIGLAVVGILCACSLVGAGGQGPSQSGTNPHVAALEQLPGFQLAYPGATLLRQGALPPSQGIDGSSGATAGKVYGIPAPVPAGVTPQGIVAWYHQRLQAQGWTLNIHNESGYQAQEYWINAKYYFEIGVYDPAFLHYYHPWVDPTKYPLVFDVTVGER